MNQESGGTKIEKLMVADKLVKLLLQKATGMGNDGSESLAISNCFLIKDRVAGDIDIGKLVSKEREIVIFWFQTR